MKKHFRLVAFIVVLILLLEINPIYANNDFKINIDNNEISIEDIEHEIDQYVEKYSAGLASLELAVFDEKGVLLEKAYGYKDIENKILADSDTVYEWGSSSKLLVWVSVMQLYEQGKIDLDEDIREYLPKDFLKKLKYKEEKITMNNLMSHNAGFQESFYENQLANEDELFDNLEEAVKSTESYQAYHVGEYTAYSNWGTALAAYIVENVSGEDFVSYVNNHIFKPLNMNHTSIDPKISDNDYVKEKRNELKSYYRGENSEDNQDLGIARSYVQLFPAGACIGTLADFAKFAQAFVSLENPLFEKEETRRKMFEATSFYTDSDIVKNAHGLWTFEYKIQVLGHAGNTMGCSSNLVFDPVSKTGMVIMTNEPGETIFNYGLPKVLYKSIEDRDTYDGEAEMDDISGVYIQKRAIAKGLGSFQQYLGGILPLAKMDDTYSVNLFGFDMAETTISKIAENSYIMDNGSGMEMFLYSSKTDKNENRLEMMSTDYVNSKSNLPKFISLILGIFFGVISIIFLIVKFIIWIIKKLKNKASHFSKNVTIAQILWGILSSSMILYLGTNMVLSPNVTMIVGIVIALMAIISIFNGFKLAKMAIKGKSLKMKTKIHYLIWSLISLALMVFIIVFELYNFWSL